MGNCANPFFYVFDERSPITGAQDLLVVISKSGSMRSSALCCFLDRFADNAVQLIVNGQKRQTLEADEQGRVFVKKPKDQFLKSLALKVGENLLLYRSGSIELQCRAYLISQSNRLVISDIDGTVTEQDVVGTVSMFGDWNYTHPSYTELVKKIQENGYQMVWLTMKPLTFHKKLRDYIDRYVNVKGPIITSRQSISQAFKDQISGQTVNFKCTIMEELKDCFQHFHPFAGGLGNRRGDLVAYIYGKCPLKSALIVNTKGQIFNAKGDRQLSYKKVLDNIQEYFPRGGMGLLEQLN